MITRWNSILIMIRSVLNLSVTEIASIKTSMPVAIKQQREVKKKFSLSSEEREMLEELKEILEWFEFVKDEFQANDVSSSRVYPSEDLLFIYLFNLRISI